MKESAMPASRRPLRALSALLLVGTTGLLFGASLGAAPAHAAASGTQWFDDAADSVLTVQNGEYVDGYGRQVVLHGFNVSGESKLAENKGLPFASVADAQKSAAAMRNLTGADSVRFLITWAYSEPRPGQMVHRRRRPVLGHRGRRLPARELRRVRDLGQEHHVERGRRGCRVRLLAQQDPDDVRGPDLRAGRIHRDGEDLAGVPQVWPQRSRVRPRARRRPVQRAVRGQVRLRTDQLDLGERHALAVLREIPHRDGRRGLAEQARVHRAERLLEHGHLLRAADW